MGVFVSLQHEVSVEMVRRPEENQHLSVLVQAKVRDTLVGRKGCSVKFRMIDLVGGCEGFSSRSGLPGVRTIKGSAALSPSAKPPFILHYTSKTRRHREKL